MLSNNAKAVEPSVFTEAGKPEDEFKPFEPTVMREVPKSTENQPWVQGDKAFKIKSTFWESLLSDPWMKRELEKTVQLRVEERCRIEAEQAREQGRKEGTEKGFAHGEAMGKQKAEAEFQIMKDKYTASLEMVLNRMNQLSLEVIRDKKNILEQHGRMWSRAFADIIRKLPMAPVPGWEAKIDRWLELRLEPFLNTAKINVAFSPIEYDCLMDSGTDLTKCNWQLLKDESLKNGEVRVECSDGGLFFSKEESTAAILDILTKDQENESEATI